MLVFYSLQVTKVFKVEPDFHARFHAQKRTYFYRIASGYKEQMSLFHKGQTWNVRQDLDINLMKEAAKMLQVKHTLCYSLTPLAFPFFFVERRSLSRSGSREEPK